MIDGHQYSSTANQAYSRCKLRYYAQHTFDLPSLTCISMTILDRCWVSSQKVYLREILPETNQTILNIFVVFLLIAFHNIPLIIYFDATTIGRYLIFSLVYSYYYLYIFQICLHDLFRIFFFRYLLYWHWNNWKIEVKRLDQIIEISIDNYPEWFY
jgi:hypothetical protein